MKECVENLSEEEDKEKLVASLWGFERCLRVLESVFFGTLKLVNLLSVRRLEYPF